MFPVLFTDLSLRRTPRAPRRLLCSALAAGRLLVRVWCASRGRIILGLALLGGCPGCTHPAARRLQGEWVGESVENIDLSQLAVATGWARGLRFDFHGAMVTVTVPTELPRSGPFRVVRATDRTITVAIERPDHQIDTADFALDTARSMRWRISDGRSIVFRRQD